MKYLNKKLLVVVLVLLLAGAGIYFFVLKDDNKPPQVQEFTAADEIPVNENKSNEDDTNEEVFEDDAPVKDELAEDPVVGTASVTLSFAEQQDESIIARAFAESDGAGDCELKLSKGSEQVIKTSGSSLQTSYYQCDGFDFSVNDVPSSGIWKADVTFTDKSGAKSESNSVDFEVSK